MFSFVKKRSLKIPPGVHALSLFSEVVCFIHSLVHVLGHLIFEYFSQTLIPCRWNVYSICKKYWSMNCGPIWSLGKFQCKVNLVWWCIKLRLLVRKSDRRFCATQFGCNSKLVLTQSLQHIKPFKIFTVDLVKGLVKIFFNRAIYKNNSVMIDILKEEHLIRDWIKYSEIDLNIVGHPPLNKQGNP